MQWIGKEVLLIKEIFSHHEIPVDVGQYFMGFYIPLMGDILIDKISAMKGNGLDQILALTKHPYMVFDPNITVDFRILKFVALVYDNRDSFTFQQLFDHLKPLLIKALESGSPCAFELLYSYRILRNDTTSVELFLNRVPVSILNEKMAWSILQYCAEYDKGDLLLLYACKLNDKILTDEYYNSRIVTRKESVLYRRLCKINKLT